MKQRCGIITPLGEMTALIEQGHLCGLWFEGQKHMPGDADKWLDTPEDQLCTALREQLEAWFSGRLTKFDLPLDPQGTPFQKRVWELICSIPPGETSTYGALSRMLAPLPEGIAPAPQAVGGAVGRNRISIIIPCHRVLGSDGSLTGYAGGLGRKAALLELERRYFGGAE